MAILRGDVPGSRFSGDCMQHITLDRRQPVDYCSPGPDNGLTNHLVVRGNFNCSSKFLLHVKCFVQELGKGLMSSFLRSTGKTKGHA